MGVPPEGDLGPVLPPAVDDTVDQLGPQGGTNDQKDWHLDLEVDQERYNKEVISALVQV